MTTMTNNYAELEAISLELVDRLGEVLAAFNIEPLIFPTRYTFACPIHGGDNTSAVSIFISGSKIVGNWKCFTRECEKDYGRGILGFIKGVLSVQNNKEATFGEAVRWAKNFVGGVEYEATPTMTHNDFINITDNFNKKETLLPGSISKAEFRKKLVIPAKYYIDRGFELKTLDKFNIGVCLDKSERFFSRVVVPVLNDSGEVVVGSVARTTQPHCDICNKYHFANRPCPQNNLEEIWSQKWLNSTGFRKSSYLYNYWNAKEHIRQSGEVILVEGQGDVWRLDEAGIYNACGMFGCELHEEQMIILEKSGAMTIWVLTDDDKAGIQAREKISKMCARLYNLKFVKLKYKDIGETPT